MFLVSRVNDFETLTPEMLSERLAVTLAIVFLVFLYAFRARFLKKKLMMRVVGMENKKHQSANCQFMTKSMIEIPIKVKKSMSEVIIPPLMSSLILSQSFVTFEINLPDSCVSKYFSDRPCK